MTQFKIMTLTDQEKEEIHKFIEQGKKITDIADQLGVSRETVRKVKNAPLPNGKKADLTNFEKTFEVTGTETTAEQLLKSVGSLAPKILKERLEAGTLVLSICGNHAAAAGMNLEEYLKTLLLFPPEFEQMQADNQAIVELNQQLQSIVDQQLDRAVVIKCVNRVMMAGITYSNRVINMDTIYAYGTFLEKLRTEDPQLFNHFRKIASEPDPYAIAEANPT